MKHWVDTSFIQWDLSELELERKNHKMATSGSVLKAVDYSAPLVLELNEITILMALNTVGIVTVMGLSIYVAILAFSKKGSQELSESHFSRG
jgi:hypothetical protein